MNTTTGTGRRGRTLLVAVVALTMTVVGAGFVASAISPPPAHQQGTVGLKQVGPIDEANGFPLWYKDTNNVKLELCLDPNDSNCIMGDVPDPTKPVSFPDNFPDEAFWSAAETSIDYGSGTAQLVTAVEAAFAGGPAKAGDQVSFGRIRLRASGLVDNAEYTLTHPFGVDRLTAEPGAFKGINMTEDIGALTPDGVFDQTLGSRPGPFLKWDPAVAPAAPAGYLGDVTQEHAVVGSPYNTNFFRVEGPRGSFTGSTQLCQDPGLGNDPVALDDCIQTNTFFVQGKLATRMGVQATQASYSTSGAGQMLDIFATSETGQQIVVKGSGVPQTRMREDASRPGRYYARVLTDGPPPSDLVVTNVSDSPATVDHIAPSLFGDKVHVASAVYDNDTRTLTVVAESGADGATLSLRGDLPRVTPTVAQGRTTWTIPNLAVPPPEVTVTSAEGGSDSDDVVVTGGEDTALDVTAVITSDATQVQTNQTLTLDGLASAGTVSSYAWSVTPATGARLTPVGANGSSVTFVATAAGTYEVALTVSGRSSTSTARTTITVASPNVAPVADAGADLAGAIPTSTVALDGTASQYASAYAWTQAGTDPVQVTLKNPGTANPTFVVPASTQPLTLNFTLTITDVNGTTATDAVRVVTDPGTVSVASASYKRGNQEWRVRGSAKHCSASNLMSIYWNKPGAAPVLLGTATPALALGVCDFDFRLKNTPTALRPTAAGTVTVRSAYGAESGPSGFALQ